MSFYLDASAAVSIILQDAHTAVMETWLTRVEEAIVVSDLAALEVAAVVSRQVRMGRMAPPEDCWPCRCLTSGRPEHP